MKTDPEEAEQQMSCRDDPEPSLVTPAVLASLPQCIAEAMRGDSSQDGLVSFPQTGLVYLCDGEGVGSTVLQLHSELPSEQACFPHAGDFPDLVLSQPASIRVVVDDSEGWSMEEGSHYAMLSGEFNDAVASFMPEDYAKEEIVFTQPDTDTHGESPSRLLTVYLQPYDQTEDSVALQGSNICQVVCDINSPGQMVMLNASSKENTGELETAIGQASIQLETVVPLSLPDSAQSCLTQTQSTSSYLQTPVLLSNPYFSQLHQTPYPMYADSVGVAFDSQAKVSEPSGTSCDSKSKRPCNCTKSQCLKLYCDCFANGEICSSCNCINCYNNMEHESERYKAIKMCLDRNPGAFRPKIASGKQGEVKGRHNKGCNCKRSGCLKNYCECYEAKIMCSSTCKCIGCKNYSNSPERRTIAYGDTLDSGFFKATICQTRKCPLALITFGTVKAACGHFMSKAEEAERQGLARPQAERIILEEFGRCLTQIVHSMFESGCLKA